MGVIENANRTPLDVPRLILAKADLARTLALNLTIQMLASEMVGQRPGFGVVVSRLTDVLFVKMIRAHVEVNRDSRLEEPWLRAIFDPKIGLALRAIHGKVDKPWTVESLASTAGMSRSAFAARFKDLLGQPPLEHVTDWRMQKAVQLLHGGKGIFRDCEVGRI